MAGYREVDVAAELKFWSKPNPEPGLSDAVVGEDVFNNILLVVDDLAAYTMSLEGEDRCDRKSPILPPSK